jgi:hypothetical protein
MGNFCGKCGTPLPVDSDADSCWRHGGPPLKSDAQVKCPLCRELILADAKKCRHCGEFLPERPVYVPPVSVPVTPPTVQPMKKQSQTLTSMARKHPIWATVVVLFLVALAVANVRNEMLPEAPSSHDQDSTSAKEASSSTRTHISNPTQFDRFRYARDLDQHMIESGIESTTTAVGPDCTTLRITYALAGRVMANDLQNKIDFERLKQLGFKKVVLTNGFHGGGEQSFEWPVF